MAADRRRISCPRACSLIKTATRSVEDTLCKFPFVAARKLRSSISQETSIRKLTERLPPVVVSLTAGYIDSSGVASLVEALKAQRKHGVRFILFGPCLQLVSRLIKVVGVEFRDRLRLRKMEIEVEVGHRVERPLLSQHVPPFEPANSRRITQSVGETI